MRPQDPILTPRSLRPAAAIWLACLGYAVLRVGAPFLRTTWLWSVDLARFLPAWAAALSAACFAATLIPAGSRVVAGVALAAMRRARRFERPLVIGAAALAAALLPDLVMWVGDSLLRHGILELPAKFGAVFPQSLPLDAWLNSIAPRAAAAPLGIDPNLVTRVIGAAAAGVFAAWSLGFARVIGARGATRLLVALMVLGAPYFALFTGYSKPTVETCLLTLGVARYGAAMLTEDRGHLGLMVCAALALGFHRSGLALLPAVATAWILWWRAAPRRIGARETIAAGVLVVGLAAFVPSIVRVFFAFDVTHNLANPTAAAQGGVLRGAFAPMHLWDLLQIVLFLAPAAILIPVLRTAQPRRVPVRAFLWILALGFVPFALFVQVSQGVFRDWDAFAGAGVALSCLAGYGIAQARVALRRHGVAAAVLAVTLIPGAQLLVHDLLPERGLARARAFALEAPRRPVYAWATWDYVGLRALRLQRWDDARDAFHRLSQIAPHDRALLLWGTSALLARRFAEARDAFGVLSRRDPTNPLGLFGLWLAAGNLGAAAERDSALRHLDALPDSTGAAERIQMHLRYYPDLRPLVDIAARR